MIPLFSFLGVVLELQYHRLQGQQVDGPQFASQRFAKTADDFKNLLRHHVSHHSRSACHDFLARCGQGLEHCFVGKEVTVATRLVPIVKHAYLSFPSTDCTIDIGSLSGLAKVVQQITGLKVVASVYYDVITFQQRFGIRLRDAQGVGMQVDLAVQSVQTFPCHFRLGLPDNRFVIKQLSMQVSQTDRVIIDNSQCPNACTC